MEPDLNKQRRQLWTLIAGIVLTCSLLGVLTYMNYQFSQQNPGGNDFLVHWMGTRTYFIEGYSPYSDETAIKIQTFAYGRPAEPGEHELRVAYPLYSMLIFLPFAFVGDYNLARALWMTTLELGLIGLTFLSLRMIRWRPGLFMLVIILLFSLFWYHAIRPLINGNAVILVALGLVAGVLAMVNKKDEAAGILFALTTIKPQVVLFPLLFIVFYSFFQRRWRIIIWLVGTVGLLSALAALLIPDWLMQNLREVMRYTAYNPPGTPGAAFAVWLPATGETLGYLLGGLMGVILLVEWFLARHADLRVFLWTFSITLIASQWIGIQTDPGNYIVLFPSLLLLVKVIIERWKQGGAIVSILLLLILFIGLWGLFISTIEYGYQPQQSPIMIFPLPGLLLILLYWVRWWARRASPNLSDWSA